MSEAITSIREARDQLRAEAANRSEIEANSYPSGIVEAALNEARTYTEPGLFDRAFYIKSVCAGSSDMNAFGGPFSEVYNASDAELDSENLSALNGVIDDITSPEYVFRGRTRTRLRSGPFPIKKAQDDALIERLVYRFMCFWFMIF